MTATNKIASYVRSSWLEYFSPAIMIWRWISESAKTTRSHSKKLLRDDGIALHVTHRNNLKLGMAHFELDASQVEAVVRVIGVGGCGGNIVNHMIERGIENVEYICANTDAQVLRHSRAGKRLLLGKTLTRGLGSGANPDIGRQAALEDWEAIRAQIYGTDLLIIAAGMGGGTGTGAAPVVADIAKELGILTVAMVTMPFSFEGTRKQIALRGAYELAKSASSLLLAPNETLVHSLDRGVTLDDAFKSTNDVLSQAVDGLASIIDRPGMINVDFADIQTIFTGGGLAATGSFQSSGSNRARLAAQKAVVKCSLFGGVDLSKALGILVSIEASRDSFQLQEMYDVMSVVKEMVSESTHPIIGTIYNDKLGKDLRVTILATFGQILPPLDSQSIREMDALIKSIFGSDEKNSSSEQGDFSTYRQKNEDVK